MWVIYASWLSILGQKKADATPFLINVWVFQKDIFWLFQGNSKAKALVVVVNVDN